MKTAAPEMMNQRQRAGARAAGPRHSMHLWGRPCLPNRSAPAEGGRQSAAAEGQRWRRSAERTLSDAAEWDRPHTAQHTVVVDGAVAAADGVGKNRRKAPSQHLLTRHNKMAGSCELKVAPGGIKVSQKKNERGLGLQKKIVEHKFSIAPN